MNTSASSLSAVEAAARVREIQTKLHQWAKLDPNRRFDDLYNLVCDPSFLLIAWRRVRGNRGARSAGVDAQTAYSIRAELGAERFLGELRRDLRARTFQPLPVREQMIPKAGGKRRRLGIPKIASYCLSSRYSPESSVQVVRIRNPLAARCLHFGSERHA